MELFATKELSPTLQLREDGAWRSKTLVAGWGAWRTATNPQRRVGNKSLRDLVAEAFLGPKPAGRVVVHLNGDRGDFRACNLAYGAWGSDPKAKRLIEGL